jgi:hypothetical protein
MEAAVDRFDEHGGVFTAHPRDQVGRHSQEAALQLPLGKQLLIEAESSPTQFFP